MDRESSTFGLGSDRLAQLFGIGGDEPPAQSSASESDKKAELLHDILAEAVPLFDSIQDKPDDFKQTIDALSGESVGKLLLDPETNIALIRKIKDYARRLSGRAESQARRYVSNTIYYGAIANALVFHEVLITKFSKAELAESFQKLTNQQWIPEYLGCLFEEGLRRCQKT